MSGEGGGLEAEDEAVGKELSSAVGEGVRSEEVWDGRAALRVLCRGCLGCG